MSRIDTQAWADFWRVDRRTVQRWLKAGLPVEDKIRMAHQVKSMKNPAPATLRVAHELLLAAEGRLPDPQPSTSRTASTAAAQPPSEEIDWEGIESDEETPLPKVRAAYLKKLKRAMEFGLNEEIERWDRLVRGVDETIRRQQLHAQKLGLDQGQVLSREQVDRLLHAIGFYLMRGIDAAMDRLEKHIEKTPAGLLLRTEIASELHRTRILEPFAGASAQTGSLALPGFVVELLRDVVDDCIEDGDQIFAAWLKEVGK